ncbi:MAG: phosphoesterase [Gemmataceae bacterium]|nr:phosphoesterase [Gemmataceae bacterium]
MVEKILVLPRADVPERILQHGFTPVTDELFLQLVNHPNLHFMDRPAAEINPAFKQLIPYVIIRLGKEYFNYRRGKSGSEARLRELRSMGVGGHIDQGDISPSDPLYMEGLRRELREEVGIHQTPALKTLGFINDDSNEVGKVHIGIVHLLDVDDPGLTSRETHLVDCRFSPLPELLSMKDHFETWSQLILPHLPS